MPITECARNEVVTAGPRETVYEIARLMNENNVGSVVITEEARPVGIVTDRDLVLRVVSRDLDPRTTAVREIMTRDLITVREDIGIYDAMGCARSEGVRRLPIVNGDGELVGIITVDDIIRLLTQEMRCVTDIIASATPSGRVRAR